MSHHIHQKLHDHFTQALRACAPRDHGRRGKFRVTAFAVGAGVAAGAAGGAAIKDVVPGLAKDLQNAKRATGILLYGTFGIPSFLTCHQGPLAECWVTAPLGMTAETDPAYMANMVQPVVAADGTIDLNFADVYILANDGTTLRIRIENMIGDQQDPVNALYGWWLDAYVAAVAFARTGSNLLADVNWGYGRQTLLWLLGAGKFGSGLFNVADLVAQFQNGWRAILSTGLNVPAGVTAQHVYWFAALSAQADGLKLSPPKLLCRGPWGEDQVYQYGDADARQYFPLGSIDCIAAGAPMPLLFPQVSMPTPVVIESPSPGPAGPATLPPAVLESTPVSPISYPAPIYGIDKMFVVNEAAAVAPFEFYSSADGKTWGDPVAKFAWNSVNISPSATPVYWCIGHNGVYGPSTIQPATAVTPVDPAPATDAAILSAALAAAGTAMGAWIQTVERRLAGGGG